MSESTTFHVRVDDGPERTIVVRTNNHHEAAMAVPALLGLRPPIKVEIWLPGSHSHRCTIKHGLTGLEVVPD